MDNPVQPFESVIEIDMALIESYDFEESGLHIVLIRDSWQIAQLNYSDEYHINNIKNLKKHQKSDKALSLLVGSATLIYFDDHKNDNLNMVSMKRGTSYNIPKNVWYAIAMSEGSQLFTVEKSNTHSNDVTTCSLNEVQLKTIRQSLKGVLNHIHE